VAVDQKISCHFYEGKGRLITICVKMNGLKLGVEVMTIRKKGSRKIVVEQESYRWVITA
jgi:hypothetical protein